MQVERLRKCLAFDLSGALSELCAGMRVLNDVTRGRTGATIIEYAFLAGLVALAAVVAFGTMGDAVAGMFDVISNEFVPAMAASL